MVVVDVVDEPAVEAEDNDDDDDGVVWKDSARRCSWRSCIGAKIVSYQLCEKPLQDKDMDK